MWGFETRNKVLRSQYYIFQLVFLSLGLRVVTTDDLNAADNVKKCLDDFLLLYLGRRLNGTNGSLCGKAELLLVGLSTLQQLYKHQKTGADKTNASCGRQ